MRCQRLMVLTVLLLFTQDYAVSAQYATVMECLPQAAATIARPIVQSAGQFVLPAVIQPILPGYDSCALDLAAGYPNYGNYPAPFPGFPPIILDDDDDIWHHLLYFLIFAMKNKKGNCSNTPPNYGGCNCCSCCSCCSCGSSGSSSCKCSCGCPNCNKNNQNNNDNSCNAPTYIPIPIAIPVYTGPDGCRYIDGFCDDILIQGPSGQTCSCNSCSGREANEINLIIKTDC